MSVFTGYLATRHLERHRSKVQDRLHMPLLQANPVAFRVALDSSTDGTRNSIVS